MLKKESINNWLLKYQFLEITNCDRNIKWINEIYLDLKKKSKNNSDISRVISRALNTF